MQLLKDNEKWKVYQDNGYKFFYRKKGSISWGNAINVEENIYLVQWKVNLTLGEKSEILEAPAKIYIPEKTYHKIEALNDIIFILLP